MYTIIVNNIAIATTESRDLDLVKSFARAIRNATSQPVRLVDSLEIAYKAPMWFYEEELVGRVETCAQVVVRKAALMQPVIREFMVAASNEYEYDTTYMNSASKEQLAVLIKALDSTWINQMYSDLIIEHHREVALHMLTIVSA